MEKAEAHTATETNNDQDGGKKKRIADHQLAKDDDVESTVGEEDSGPWRKANEETISQRRRVKVRRSGSTTLPSSEPSPLNIPTFNFSPKPAEKKEEESKESKEEATEEKKTDSPSTFTYTAAPVQFSFATSFTFSSSTSPTTTSVESASSNSIFGENVAKPSSSTEPSQPVGSIPEPSKFVPSSEPIRTGEEDETHVYQTKAKLFILDKTANSWKERGVGQLRVNVANDKSRSRLIMRVDGSLRLVLNVRLWPNIVFEKTGEKGVRFVAPDVENTAEITTYLVRVGRGDSIDALIKTLNEHKGYGQSTENAEKKEEKKEEEKKEKKEKKEEKSEEKVEKKTEEKTPEKKGETVKEKAEDTKEKAT